MLDDRLRELLAAAVSGELSPAEKRRAERLLQESEEARQLFRQLREDARQLNALPRMRPPQDLAASVLSQIRDRALMPTPLPTTPHRPSENRWIRLPIWAAYASAACVFALVFLGSFAYFSLSQEIRNREGVARKTEAIKPVESQNPQSIVEEPRVAETPKAPQIVAENRVPYRPEAAPAPREVGDSLLLSPSLPETPEINPLQLDKIRLSKFFTPNELLRDSVVQDKLMAELKKDELIRSDLFCAQPAKSLDHLSQALASQGVQLIVDSSLRDRIKRNQPTEIVLFVDSLTPADMVKLFVKCARDDEKRNELDTLVVAPFMPTDLNKLGRLLGASNVLPKPSPSKSNVDPRKPLPEGTANQLFQSLTNMGQPGTSEKADKVAIALAYNPMNANPTNSREVRQFLDKRGSLRKPETKPLMLVLLSSK